MNDTGEHGGGWRRAAWLLTRGPGGLTAGEIQRIETMESGWGR